MTILSSKTCELQLKFSQYRTSWRILTTLKMFFSSWVVEVCGSSKCSEMEDFIRHEYMSVSAKRKQGCPDNCITTEMPESLWFKSLSPCSAPIERFFLPCELRQGKALEAHAPSADLPKVKRLLFFERRAFAGSLGCGLR